MPRELRLEFRQREEQFFLRVSSNRPLAEFKDTEPVTILLGRFRKVLNREASKPFYRR
jgi:hypothetical protein